MFVGTARFVIHIPAAQTLKDRRRVVNQLKDRIRARFSVSVCEVGNAERYQVASIAIATVAREAESCRQVIAAARRIADTMPDALLADTKGEVLSFGVNGEQLRGGIESLSDDGIESEPALRKRVSRADQARPRMQKLPRKQE